VTLAADKIPTKPTAAFTLVEIMIVVVIIGLLAAIAIPAFQRIRAKSQDTAVMGNARQLSGAVDQYFMETGRTTVAQSVIIGPAGYVKGFQTVANETYPSHFTQGQPITVTGIADLRTVTYAP
jgi:type IV pilus assembly protein PilA